MTRHPQLFRQSISALIAALYVLVFLPIGCESPPPSLADVDLTIDGSLYQLARYSVKDKPCYRLDEPNYTSIRCRGLRLDGAFYGSHAVNITVTGPVYKGSVYGVRLGMSREEAIRVVSQRLSAENGFHLEKDRVEWRGERHVEESGLRGAGGNYTLTWTLDKQDHIDGLDLTDYNHVFPPR
jgi:hypothetical protein